MIRINEWYGRLGNNITQMIHAIYIAKQNNLKFIYPDHPIITNKIFDYTNIKTNTNINYVGHFYFPTYDFLNDYPPKENIKDILLTEIKPLIKYNKQNIELTDDDLVIHIRSGDVFLPGHYDTKGVYAQPPLSFYEKILNETNYNKYYLLAENNHNPVIDILLKKYPKIIPIIGENNRNVTIINNELINDLYYFMEAKNIVISNGTLLYMICPLNQNIKKFYAPQNLLEECNNFHIMKTKEYIYYLNNCIEYNYYFFDKYYIDTSIFILLSYPIENIRKITITF